MIDIPAIEKKRYYMCTISEVEAHIYRAKTKKEQLKWINHYNNRIKEVIK